MSDVSEGGGVFEMGCDYASGVCPSVSGDESVYLLKGSMSYCGGWTGSTMCTFCNCCCTCCSGIGSVIVIG